MMLLPILWGCSGTPAPTAPAPSTVDLDAPLPGDSIYQVDAELETADGERVPLAVPRGHPTIVSMFYANCPMACPMLIQDIRTLEEQLDATTQADLRVLLVSLDPERDTPELMSGVIETHGIDRARWTLGRTDPDTVREIAAVLGVRYRALADGEMNHSSILTLVDRQGRVVHTTEGLKQDAAPLIAALQDL